jgi:peptidase E
VRTWRKVLLVTAAWQRNEHQESHVKQALADIGIPTRLVGEHDENIQNLSVYHEFNRFRRLEPELHRQYHEKQAVIIKTKEFYRRKNSEFVRMLREQVKLVKESYADVSLAEILGYDVVGRRRLLPRMSERELVYHYACRDIQDTLAKLVENDEAMVRLCREVERAFRVRSRVDENPLFISMRDELCRRILSSNSIFIFGGRVSVLLYRLWFFRLHDALREALWRGTNFYGVSAGSVVLAEKVILYDDFWGSEHGRPRKEFEFFDNGLGLVSQVTLFPHCQDRIQTDSADNLSYLAHRFSSGVCVGLNEQSFLLIEPVSDRERAHVHERMVSVGTEDGVYVFDRSGQKLRRDFGQEVLVPDG